MLIDIVEIILYVEDMQAMVEFYRDTLGLAVSYPLNKSDYRREHWVTFDTGYCKLALHGGGGCDFGKDAPKFVFAVADLTQARQSLSARGVRLGNVRSPAPGVEVCDGFDSEGNKFSIESRNTR